MTEQQHSEQSDTDPRILDAADYVERTGDMETVFILGGIAGNWVKWQVQAELDRRATSRGRSGG